MRVVPVNGRERTGHLQGTATEAWGTLASSAGDRINAAKDLTEITDPATVVALRLTYDTQHNITRRTDRRGGLWDFAYDFAGKLKADTMPIVAIAGANARPVVRFRSSESVVLVDPGSGYGTISNPAPRVDPSAVRAEVTNPRGFVTKYALDRWGAATRVEEPLGRLTQVWRNVSGQDTLTISPRGDSVRIVWTGPNLTQIVRRPLGRAITIEYEPLYNQLKRAYGDVDSLWNYWSSSGRLDSTRVGRGTDPVTKFKSDSRGRDTLITDPKNHKTRRYFASTGWQNTDSVKAETRRTAFSYDGFGRDTLRKDPQNNIWKTTYDAINRVLRRIGPAPVNDTTTFIYDSLYVRAVVDANAQRYAFLHNALGRVVSDTNPLGAARSFAFDSNGNVVSATNRRGQTLTLAYDSLDNLRSQAASDVGTTTFISDPLGRFVAISNAESTDTLWFDMNGRPTSEITVRAGARYELTSAFDVRDRRTRLQVAGPAWTDSIRYRYNYRSALDTLIDVSGGSTRFAYDADGSLVAIQLPNGVDVTHGFPSTHTPSRIQYTAGGINDALGRRYGYDSLARAVERLNATASAGREFLYDQVGRLREYRDFHVDGSCTPVYEYDDPPPGTEPIGWDCSQGRVVDQTVTYTYDKVGNRLDLGAIVTTGNRLVKFNGDSLVYDADGNLIRRMLNGIDLQRLYWNSLGQLVAFWRGPAPGDSINYAYDGAGRRVRRSTPWGSRQYVHDGDELFAEIDGGSTIFGLYSYYPGIDHPHSVRRVGNMYYYTLDVPGNVSGMLDASGAVINRFTYAPFGELQDSDVGMPSEPLRFNARELEGETGFYFMRARHYDPSLGRFISEDPIGLDGGINLYAFAGNDPVNARDPLGLGPGCEVEQRPAEDFIDPETKEEGRRLVATVVCETPGGGFSVAQFWNDLWVADIPWGSTHLVSTRGGRFGGVSKSAAVAQVPAQHANSCIQAKGELAGNVLLDLTLLTGIGAGARAAKLSRAAFREANQAFRRGEYWTSSMTRGFEQAANQRYFSYLAGGALVARLFLQEHPFREHVPSVQSLSGSVRFVIADW